MQNLNADIAYDEARVRAKDAAVRKRILAEALQRADEDKEAAEKEQATAPLAGPAGPQPANPSATE
eukprot:14721510-Heterocapsa_arctica.AAC.1